MSTIECRELRLLARGTPILDQIDQTFEGPALETVCGPSGCGKSSLLRAFQRLIENGREGWKVQGDIRLNGKSILGPKVSKQEVRRRIGFVFQRPFVFDMTVRENVEYGLYWVAGVCRRSKRRDLAERALQRVGLVGEVPLDRNAKKLSGGQQQRLCIARVCALDPEVLLMDEPTSALDPECAHRIENIVRELAVERLVVLVTHHIHLARLSDRVTFMFPEQNGTRIAECGGATNVLDMSPDTRIRSFVEAANRATPVGTHRLETSLVPVATDGDEDVRRMIHDAQPRSATMRPR